MQRFWFLFRSKRLILNSAWEANNDNGCLPFSWIRFLGLHEPTEIPSSCQSAFDVTCHRMEERLTYLKNEQVHFLFPVNIHSYFTVLCYVNFLFDSYVFVFVFVFLLYLDVKKDSAFFFSWVRFQVTLEKRGKRKFLFHLVSNLWDAIKFDHLLNSFIQFC